MKRTIADVCVAVLLGLQACGLSNESGKTVDIAPLMSAKLADCDSAAPVRKSDVAALPGGIWKGTLVNCAKNTRNHAAVAWVSEDGRFRLLGDSGHLLRGSMDINGNTFASSGLDFAAWQSAYYSGGSTQLFIDGSIIDRSFLVGRWGTAWGSYGHFTLRYQRDHYEHPSSIDALAGSWQASRYPGNENSIWTIDADGRLNGQDSAGCLLSGRFALIDDRYNLYDIELSVSGCPIVGSYKGFATLAQVGSETSALLLVSVDDGMQRTLRIDLRL